MYILGEVEEATSYLTIFKWGPTFLTLNHDPLESYRRARTEGKVIQAQREYFPHLFEAEDSFQRAY